MGSIASSMESQAMFCDAVAAKAVFDLGFIPNCSVQFDRARIESGSSFIVRREAELVETCC